MKKEIEVTRVYRWLRDSKAQINILRGGTGSSKSYSTAQHFIINKLCSQRGKVILIARKTLPALKKTAYRLTLELLEKYGVPYRGNRTELEYRVNGNILYFLSLDDPDKIKSLNSHDIWLEEATEFSFEGFMQFYLRLEGQIYLTFNPADGNHWIKKEIIDRGTYDYAEDVSTYKDNLKFLPPARIKKIENLINQDESYHRIYALGQWGILKGLIYSFPTVDIPEDYRDITYGMDFGFNNPSALVRVYWLADDRAIWQEVLYRQGLINTEWIKEVEGAMPVGHKSKELFADSAEPARIEEFYRAGFNIKPAEKSVKDGIDFCKQHVIGITRDSANLIKERQSYKYKKDRNSNVLDEPVRFNDHALSAGRYGTYSVNKYMPDITII